MTLNDAVKLARKLMDENNLKDWRIVINTNKRRAGYCRFSNKTIAFSMMMVENHTDKSIRNTITHEIAHALAGPKHHHDNVWREIHIRLGGDGQRCYDSDSFKDGENGELKYKEEHFNYVAVCKNGHVHYRNKLPRRRSAQYSCSTCCGYFNPDYLLEFKPNPKKKRF